MGSPVSILGGARAFARDFPRDQMPPGYLWDIIDYVPGIIDASLTGRGGWLWASDPVTGDFEAGILATYTAGDQLLYQTTNGDLWQVDQNTGAVTSRGKVPRARQNPVQLYDTVVHFDTTGGVVPTLITATGAPTAAPASAPKARVGAIWGEYVITDGGPGFDDTVRFCVPGDPTQPWDANAFQRTGGTITGLAALRSVILVFHAGFTERIRGSIPPHAQVDGDLLTELAFARAGCPDPKAIAYWNENIIFADEHGVHMTDGAVIRNLASQGGISYFWRTLWGSRLTISACVFLDYYQITVRPVGNGPSVTLICNLNTRQWFRFQNVYALSYVASGGGIGMERIWAGMAGTGRLGRVSACYFPVFGTGSLADADGAPVMPEFETPWYRLGAEGRKRVRFAYLSYDVRSNSLMGADDFPGAGTYERESDGGAPSLTAVPEILELSYIRTPQTPTYTIVGSFPSTPDYRRFRLPIGQFPYGVAFKVRQTAPATVHRVFDLAVEAQGVERSRT